MSLRLSNLGIADGNFTNGTAEGREGETMSDQTHLLERIMGLQVELHHFGECSRQQQIHYDAELSRLRHENRNLQARHHALPSRK